MVLGRIHTNRLINRCSEMSTLYPPIKATYFHYFVDRSSTAFQEMAESQATRKPTTPKKSISSTAKRPQKTQKFLDDIKQALDDFDDKVFSFSCEQHEVAYHNFATYYRDALTAIWPKATDASIKTVLKSVTDKQLQELKHMACLLKPDQPKPTVVTEKLMVPALENILGVMTSRLPQQNLPSTDVCGLISYIFSDLSTAHGFQAKAAQGIAELASLITPEQMTLVLDAAVPPTIQIVLPPLSTPPLPPTTAATEVEQQDVIKYCKKNILPDPAADCFDKCDKKAPTRVLAAAIFCTLERKYFDEKTPRANVATMFQVTTAQLMKAVTGVDYMSGPHPYTKKRKMSAESSTSTATPTPKSPAETTTSATALKVTQEEENTLSSSSSDLPPL